MTPKIHEAVYYAGKRHAGQVRKGTSIPYIVHPLEVMGILIENGCSEDVIVAGILHDIIEDTCDNNDTIRDIVRSEIREKFGEGVLKIVNCESEDKSKSWEERKQHTIDCLKTDSLEVRLVCCGDKLSNIMSIESDKNKIGDKVFRRFNAPKEKLAWYYRSIGENLHLEGYKMFDEYKSCVERVFGKD